MIEPLNPEGCLILVIDDVPLNLKLVGEMLGQVGYATLFAADATQAIAILKLHRPDLVLLDLMMPDIDGLELCQRLKADPDYQDIPIIFLTASTERHHLVTAFGQGAVDYVTKPFYQAELLARVKTHLMLKRTTDHLKVALADMERLAREDTLTGLLNRRSLFEAATQEFQRAQRYGTEFSALLLDVDHFKTINDTYGHQTGDVVLRSLAIALKRLFRTVDWIGRYGGEEFVVVLPETNLKQAQIAAERARRAIAELTISPPSPCLTLTISIGIAAYQPDDQSIDELFNRADQALYLAKSAGRNTCAVLSAS